MNIALTLLEQWGLYLITGLIIIYFGWHGLTFLRTQSITFRNDPILSTTTLGWGSIWVVGNGVGNTLFIFGVVSLVDKIVTYHTQGFSLPPIPGSEAIVFFLGLMPSLYQFRYQSDPGYLETLTLGRRMIAISLTIADGVFCALGWYWWLLPPSFNAGQFDFPFDQSLLVGVFAWSIFSSYIAQYMAHMQLYDLLGLEPPHLPNPFAALWQDLLALLHRNAEDEPERKPAQRGIHAKATRPRRKAATPTVHMYEPTDERISGMPFDEWEPQS